MAAHAHELELLEELRALWRRVPGPPERWHPGWDAIAELHADVEAALHVLDTDATAREALALVLAEGGPTSAPAAHWSVGAAIRRLAELPRPDGKHPYLEELLPGLEAAEVLLQAVARSPAASARFGEVQRAPATTPTGS